MMNYSIPAPFQSFLTALAAVFVLSFFASASSAQTSTKPQLDDFDWRDNRYHTKQWNQIDELSRHHLGTQLKGDNSDLDVLQRLIYKGVINKDDRERLQALGVVLGTVMEKELNLTWKIYNDQQGRSRALCVEESGECLFPITMLSRRMEVGLVPNVSEVYDKARSLIEPHLSKLPYQVK